MNTRLLTDALRGHRETAYTIQRQLASGRKVNLASDDPGAYEAIRNLSADQSLLGQFVRNADMAHHYLTMVDQGLSQAGNLLHRVNELVVRAGDGTLDTGTRAAMAEEVDQLLLSLMSVANSSEGGRHTFAGLRTDTQPYVGVDSNGDGLFDAIDYHGSEESRRIKTGQTLYVTTNIAGSTSVSEGGIFQTATRDLFGSVIRLRDALRDGTDLSTTDIPGQIEDDLAHLLNQVSLNGARMDQVATHRAFTMDMQVTTMQSLASLESVDMAEAFMRLSQAETAYQAALQSSARMLQQVSLLHYL